MNAPESDRLDLATVNGMMNLCEAKEQARLDEAAAITEPEKRREAYARRLREFYAKEGMAMNEETIGKAVDEYLENEMAFQEPAGGFASFLAALFVYRMGVTLFLMFSAMVMAVCLLAVFLVMDGNHRSAFEAATQVTTALESELKNAQEAVASGEQAEALNTKSRAEQLAAKALPELIRNPQAELDQEAAKNFTAAEHALTLANEEASGYRAQLAGTKNYHSKSTAAWEQLGRDADAAKGKIENELAASSAALTAIAGIQKTQTSLDSLARLWQSLTGELAGVPPKWKSLAQANLDAGAAELAQGDVHADNALQAAKSAIGDGNRWAALAAECRNELNAGHSCQTKDAAAQSALSAAETAVQQALDEEDLERAKKSAALLKDTVAQINQAYQVRIVCRTGFRSVIQRTEHHSRANRYYAIVESVNEGGLPVQRRIQNREDGAFLQTAMWGQEIPQSLYQELYHEKSATGAIQDLSFGMKEPGYLEPKYTRAPGSNHEITSW